MSKEEKKTVSHVYEAISAITEELSKEGIKKERKNTQGNGYSFRGIDDVLNHLGPLLPKHKLIITPTVTERVCVERETKSGGAIFYVTLCVKYDFISAQDGTTMTAVVYGEAMDTSDKATNKAMSAAYKSLCLQQFCIPTEGDNDTDNNTHEPVGKSSQKKNVQSGDPLASTPKTEPQLTAKEWLDQTVAHFKTLKNDLDVTKYLAAQEGLIKQLSDKQREWLKGQSDAHRKTLVIDDEIPF